VITVALTFNQKVFMEDEMMGEEMMGGKKMGGKKMGGKTEVNLDAPAGFDVPEGTKPGEMFEAMSTFRLNDNGQLTLEAIDGNSLSGSPEEDYEEEGEEEGKAPMKGKGGPAMGFLLAIEKGATKKGK
jgi:hypothetical protein